MKDYSVLKIYSLVVLIFSGIQLQAQVSYNKRGGTAIGVVPQPGNLSNGASVDNVELATGTLKVGIPLYEIKLDDISVPISLNYSALGLKANQAPGCVGMGWELNAGGKITTIVNGRPDYESRGLPGYNESPLLQLSETNVSLNLETNVAHRTFASEALNGEQDAAYDVYSYSLPNGGGKFMRTKNTLLTFPYNPLFNITSKGLTNGDGVFYQFSPGETKSIKKRKFYTDDDTPQYTTDWKNEYEYASAEVLSLITSSRNKDSVVFLYEYYTNQLNPSPRITTTVSMPLTKQVNYNASTGIWNTDPKYLIKEPSYSKTEVSVINSSRIKSIIFPYGRVIFDYDPDYKGEDVLSAITVQEKQGMNYNLLRKITFGYFKGISHYLTGVDIADKNNAVINSWHFNYNDYMPVNYGYNIEETKAQDRWGFYNGKTANQTLLEDPAKILALQTKNHYPIYNIDSEGGSFIPVASREAKLLNGVGVSVLRFADRDFVFSEALKGTLKNLLTPTGALIQYEYEPHQFQHRVNTNGNLSTEIRTGGGIRIKSITQYESGSLAMLSKKDYKYGMLGYGEGYSLAELESGFGIVSYPANVLTSNGVYGTSGNPSAFTAQNLSILSHPVNDMSYYGGSYGIYHNVSVYTVKDIAGTTLANKYSGKTLYFFHTPGYDLLQTAGSNNPLSLQFEPTLNIGVANDNLYGKPERIVKQSILPNSFEPVERQIFVYKRYAAPIPANPQNTYSFFPTINGTLIANYITRNFQFCGTFYNPVNQQYEFKCIPTSLDAFSPFDPLYYANIEHESSSSWYSGKYSGPVIRSYDYSDVYKLDNEDLQNYSQGGGYFINGKNTAYTYNANLLPSIINIKATQGKTTRTRIKYPNDYESTSDLGIGYLKDAYMLTEPIEQQLTVDLNSVEYVTGGILNEFTENNGLVKPFKTYELNTDGKPLPFSSFTTIKDSRYELRKTFEQYDTKGNLLQFSEAGGAKNALIWGYNGSYPIAQVAGAGVTDIAYTSFESQDQGNWNYNPLSSVVTTSPIGNSVYSLSGGSISKTDLTTTNNYVLTYWIKDGSAITLSGGTVGSETLLRNYMGWKYIERSITGTTSLTISGTGYIDDLRLHPKTALMSTYSYEPLRGISSTTDVTGKTNYYEYDNFQRLYQIKDLDGNILRRTEYNFSN